MLTRRTVGCLVLFVISGQPTAMAHGGVTLQDDLCVIKIAYLRAHFRVYQPLTGRDEQYCEDLPEATESVFVMEYLHDALRETPIDFRIIRDVTGKGRFARWDDVQKITDLEAVTVFHQPTLIEPDVFTVVHRFTDEGDYIGIVSATPPGTGSMQTAVFPFAVGFTGFGYWPLILGLLMIVQIQYLIMSGRLKSWHQRRKRRLTVVQGDLNAK